MNVLKNSLSRILFYFFSRFTCSCWWFRIKNYPVLFCCPAFVFLIWAILVILAKSELALWLVAEGCYSSAFSFFSLFFIWFCYLGITTFFFLGIRLHAQALTLAALAGAAVVEYYDHKTGAKAERVAKFLNYEGHPQKDWVSNLLNIDTSICQIYDMLLVT